MSPPRENRIWPATPVGAPTVYDVVLVCTLPALSFEVALSVYVPCTAVGSVAGTPVGTVVVVLSGFVNVALQPFGAGARSDAKSAQVTVTDSAELRGTDTVGAE